jgi:hypothetical protein
LTSTIQQIILCCSRQAGKSTTTALLGLYELLYKPVAKVLIFSPTERQSKELFLKISYFYHRMLELEARPEWEAEKETESELRLVNGNRLVALPGKEANVRSFDAVTLLIEDEASRCPDALYQAIRPMLAVSKGRLMLLSTFWGKRGHFWQAWDEGGDNWQRFRIPATMVPRISKEFLEEEKRNMPPMVFDQEYMCIPGEVEGAVFSYEEIAAMVDDSLPPLFEDEKAYVGSW